MELRNHRGLLLSVLFIFAFLSRFDFAGGKVWRQNQNHQAEKLKKKSKLVFLITEDPDNYKAHKTVPIFAEMLRKKYGYEVTVLLGSGSSGSYHFPNMDKLTEADLLIVFARRIALPHEQMNALKIYLSNGKPIIGIRTANHAFTVREKIEEGYEGWPEFVTDVLGCQNRGYGPVQPGTEVSIVAEAANHPILKNIKPKQWHSKGNIYLVAPLLDQDASILLTGKAKDITQPIAWTRNAGKSKVFYTSLGFPADFSSSQFTTLLVNAVKWALSNH